MHSLPGGGARLARPPPERLAVWMADNRLTGTEKMTRSPLSLPPPSPYFRDHGIPSSFLDDTTGTNAVAWTREDLEAVRDALLKGIWEEFQFPAGGWLDKWWGRARAAAVRSGRRAAIEATPSALRASRMLPQEIVSAIDAIRIKKEREELAGWAAGMTSAWRAGGQSADPQITNFPWQFWRSVGGANRAFFEMGRQATMANLSSPEIL